MNRTKGLILVLMAALLAPCIVCAVPVTIGDEYWDASEAGWIGSDFGANVDNGNVSWNAGELQVTINGPNSASYVRTSTGADPLLTGDLMTASGGLPIYVTFNFITTGTLPSSLGLYFASNNDGHWWSSSLSLDGLTPNDNQSYTVWVSTYAWNPLNGASSGTLFADFSDINWFGFYVQNTGAGGLIDYRFDNLVIGYDTSILEAPVPEPETVWMMLVVVCSLGLTFRGRLSGMVGQLKARFVKA